MEKAGRIQKLCQGKLDVYDILRAKIINDRLQLSVSSKRLDTETWLLIRKHASIALIVMPARSSYMKSTAM